MLFDEASAQWLAHKHKEGHRALVSRALEKVSQGFGFGPPSKKSLTDQLLVDDKNGVLIRWTPIKNTVRLLSLYNPELLLTLQ
jgi:hypothetical protein